MRLEVESTSLEEARKFAEQQLSKVGGLDKNLPNFDENYLILQRWASLGKTLRKDMPRIPSKQVKDFQKVLAKGLVDIRAPFAKSTNPNDPFPDNLSGKKAKDFLRAGKKDGKRTTIKFRLMSDR